MIASHAAGTNHHEMAHQFVHIENFSRKGDRKGRSTSFVFSEAMRRSDAALHVRDPLPPVVVFGSDVADIERLHDDRAALAKTTPKGGKERAVRKDQHTLCTVVMSHPYTMSEVLNSKDKRQEVDAWERRNLHWLKAQFGDSLVSVIRHEDEAHWHLHAYALPDGTDMKASRLHPGQVAKAAVLAAGARPGEDEKAVIKRSDHAYKAAMRRWQDAYFQAVAMPCGLSRIGPGKRRLTRAEWQAEQVQAKALQASLDQARLIRVRGEKYIKETQAAAKVITSTARQDREQAERAVLDAARIHQTSIAAQRSAERVKGLGGLLRAFWDGMRISAVREAVTAEFSARLDQAQKLLGQTAADRRIERDRRRDVEGKLIATSAALREVAGQRDVARSEVQSLRKALGPMSIINTTERKFRP